MLPDAPRRPGRPAVPITRERLIQIASLALAELGYEGASMGDIAARCGLRKSSLFHHFPSKDGLYREVLVAALGELNGRMLRAHEEAGTFFEKMERSTYAVQIYFGEHPVAARLLVREFVQGGGRMLPEGGDVVDTLFRGLVERLQGAMEASLIPKQDVRQLVLSLVGLHVLPFAMPAVSTRLLGADVFDGKCVEQRARAVCAQVARLLGATP